MLFNQKRINTINLRRELKHMIYIQQFFHYFLCIYLTYSHQQIGKRELIGSNYKSSISCRGPVSIFYIISQLQTQMQSHRGLPNNLPFRKTKAKIFSTSPSPSKRTDSVTIGDSNDIQSQLRTPERRSLSNTSKHKIGSKQKPIKFNALAKKTDKKTIGQLSTAREFNSEQKQENQIQKPQFVKTVLNMMSGILKGSKLLASQKKQKENIIDGHQNNQTQDKKQKMVFGPHLVQGSHQYRAQAKTFDDQSQFAVLKQCTKMFQDKTCWLSYNGGVADGLRQGYGILYFKNKDKFMGGFKKDKANGHGTFYMYQLGKRIMSKWQNNQLKIQQGYIIEQL